MIKLLLAFCCLLNTGIIVSQGITPEYAILIKKADSLYQVKEYKNAALMYSLAFKANNWKAAWNHRYKAACSWALANYPDSAFFQLNRIATKNNFKYYTETLDEADFNSLHSDKRWNQLLDIIKQNRDATLNKPLMARLDSIYYDDSNDRILEEEEVKKYGFNSKEVKARWKIINYKDSINILKVSSILDTYGWLGADIVGNQGNLALFLAVQHTSLKTQEKYLPLMREAVNKGNANGRDLALLEDRVAMRQEKKQVYGTQIRMDKDGGYFLFPIEDPDNVDKRRALVGLEPLADYLSNWKLTWNIEQYKKDLPSIEAKLKN